MPAPQAPTVDHSEAQPALPVAEPGSLAAVLQRAAALAAGPQTYPAGALYMLATPIGNLADLSLRAIHVLALVDAVACEDTRVSGGLLRHLGLDKPLIALHAHNEHSAAAKVLERLAAGQRVAYVSDAGTPAVSDPGAVLVALAGAAGQRVVPIPGASSASAALSVAGDTAAGGFTFVGFLPSKGPDRAAALAAAAALPLAVVLFEAPHRIEALLQALAATAPTRRLTLCRELTKQFETVVTLASADAPAWLAADANRQRGEFVLVWHAEAAAPAALAALPAPAERLLAALVQALPVKQAVSLTAQAFGLPRNRLYARALELKAGAGDGTPADAGEAEA
jgi:16S rRNA (cytidine1402-2'-O)-methyltransferase